MRKPIGMALAIGMITLLAGGSAVAIHPVTSDEIANRTIRAVDIATGAVNSRIVADGSIEKPDLSARLSGQLVFTKVPSGRTIRGAIGGDFDAHANTLDWGVVASLPVKARNALSDDHVFVNVTGWTSGDTGQTQPATTDTDPGCTGTPANPTAPSGKVCIYVAGGDNAIDVNGYSVLPGTGASPFGFKLAWTNSTTGDTFIDATWAYTAP